MFGHKIEIYFEDINDEKISRGIYSIIHDRWIRKPTFVDDLNIDVDQVNTLFDKYRREIDRVYKFGSFEDKKRLKEDIKKFRRKVNTSSNNKTCIENIVYKKLRKLGFIDKLHDNKVYDAKKSLP